MNIILYESKVDEKNLDFLKQEYLNRIEKYCNIKINNKKFAKANKEYVFNISKSSDSLSSTDFAKKISEVLINGYSNIVFLREHGIFEEIDFEISITSINVSYEMETVMLLEQIYRAFKINNNEVYHK